MLTPKIIFYKHKVYSDGTSPIMLQVVTNGKAKRQVIAKCLPSEWLKSKNKVSSRNLQYVRINDEIDKALSTFGLEKEKSFFEFLDEHIEKMKRSQQPSLHEILVILKTQITEIRPNLDFDKLNQRFISDFADHLAYKKNKPNTIRLKMQALGKLIKQAVKLKYMAYNPMEEFTFKKESVIKNKLSVPEMVKIRDADLLGRQAECRDIFMASIYLRGIRLGDLLRLKKSNVSTGRVEYVEMKTGKINSYAIRPELQLIFDRWSSKNRHGYIFNFMTIDTTDKFMVRKLINKADAIINYSLKNIAAGLGIDKRLSMHIARHSFSRLANNTIKDTTITKDLVGHSSLAIHESYISEISDNLAMDYYTDQVLNELKKGAG